MKPRVYIDTSAYLGILLEQPSGNKHKKQSDSWTLCSSTLLILESERNLVRFSREKKISEKACQRAMEQLKADVDTLILRDFMLELCLTGTFPAILTPRSVSYTHLTLPTSG